MSDDELKTESEEPSKPVQQGGIERVFCDSQNDEELDAETKELLDTMEADKFERPPLEVTVVSRDEWKALPFPDIENSPPLMFNHPLLNVMITHTGTKECITTKECKKAVRLLQRHHMALGYPDIIYNFLIGGDGKVYEGRGWHIRSGALLKYPEDFGECLKIAHVGYYGGHSDTGLDKEKLKLQYDFIETGMVQKYVAYNATMIQDYNDE